MRFPYCLAVILAVAFVSVFSPLAAVAQEDGHPVARRSKGRGEEPMLNGAARAAKNRPKKYGGLRKSLRAYAN